jgi:hypothetical protein
MKKFNLITVMLLACMAAYTQTVSTFENLTLPADTFYNGSDLAGGFSSGNAYFANDYDTTYFSWSGFSYSNVTDTISAGYGNQYSAITGVGYNNSANYAVADEYGNAKIILTGNAAGKLVNGLYITNNTYAYYSMKDGDMFAKKFGGTTGNDPDWFKIQAKAWLNGTVKPDSVEFYLADYRFSDNSQDYIVRDWQWLSLLPLGNADSIQFFLSSSDNGSFGMNTPAYFCLDNFTTIDIANVAPTVASDEVTINYATDTLIDVLANDVDVTALPLTIQLTSSPLIPGATATVVNNKVLYSPAIGIVATDTLTYKVCDAANECSSALIFVNVVALNGIEELAVNALQVYPNPVKDILNIRNDEGNATISIIDLTGKVMLNIATSDANSKVNVSDLAPGIYVVQLRTNNYVQLSRIVKQ